MSPISVFTLNMKNVNRFIANAQYHHSATFICSLLQCPHFSLAAVACCVSAQCVTRCRNAAQRGPSSTLPREPETKQVCHVIPAVSSWLLCCCSMLSDSEKVCEPLTCLCLYPRLSVTLSVQSHSACRGRVGVSQTTGSNSCLNTVSYLAH